MFKIRPEQLQAFQEETDRLLTGRICQHLVDNHLEDVKSYDPSQLAKLVKGGVARARSYGLVTERGITLFVTLLFTVSPGFYADSEIHEYLCRQVESADASLPIMVAELSDRVWERAASLSHPEYWSYLENAQS